MLISKIKIEIVFDNLLNFEVSSFDINNPGNIKYVIFLITYYNFDMQSKYTSNPISPTYRLGMDTYIGANKC